MSNIDMEIDLPVANVINSKKDNGGNILITIETTEDHVACRVCGKNLYKIVGVDKACKLKHKPAYGMNIFIIYHPHKYICEYCQGEPITIAPLLSHISNCNQGELSHAC